MKNQEKKNWEKPEVTKLSVKNITQTGAFKDTESGQGQGPTAS